jgi:hypothetical protein
MIPEPVCTFQGSLALIFRGMGETGTAINYSALIELYYVKLHGFFVSSKLIELFVDQLLVMLRK